LVAQLWGGDLPFAEDATKGRLRICSRREAFNLGGKTRNGGAQGGGGGTAVHDNIGTKGGGDPDVFCSGLAGIGCGDIREEEDATA